MAPDRVGKGLCLDDEFRVFDFVQRARAVGHLHTGLETAVALAVVRLLPHQRLQVVALRWQTACCRRGGWPASRPAPPRRTPHAPSCPAPGGDHVDQRIHHRFAGDRRQCERGRGSRHRAPAWVRAGCSRSSGSGCAWRGVFLCDVHAPWRPRPPAQPPPAMASPICKLLIVRPAQRYRQMHGSRTGTVNAQGSVEVHVFSQIGAGRSAGQFGQTDADSISTATMRETPCSCMVTPISCSAISIAILLWLMNRNCVSLLMLDTSLA